MNTKARIIIADDDEITREFFAVTFPKLGFELEAVATGREVLEKARHHTPDLIVMEALLPGTSGWAVLKELKADENLSWVPVIIMSEITDVKDVVEAFEKGAMDYITKPFNFSEVVCRLRNGARVGQQAAELRRAKALLQQYNVYEF
jgi:DNA-binding response OmpR family regulator